jgi:hypothetical protein
MLIEPYLEIALAEDSLDVVADAVVDNCQVHCYDAAAHNLLVVVAPYYYKAGIVDTVVKDEEGVVALGEEEGDNLMRALVPSLYSAAVAVQKRDAADGDYY